MTQQEMVSAPGTGTQPPRLDQIDAFRELMSRGWGRPDRSAQVDPGWARATADHRRRLAEALPGQVLVVAAGRAPVRANDTSYDFRPHSAFAWLAATNLEGSVLVLRPGAGQGGAALYVEPAAAAGSVQAFRDAARGELWVGGAPGTAELAEALQLEVRPLEQLPEALASAGRFQCVGPLDAGLVPTGGLPPSDELARVLSELRGVKDDWEVGELRKAVDATVAGFAATAAELGTAVAGGGERWLQGTFDRHARTYGNGVGYATIVGSGPHAPVLHWVRCDGAVAPEDLVLLDMGVETRTYYTADVSRTLPAGGTYTPAQRELYALVERSHRAGIAAVRPGARFSDFHHAAMEVLAHGLADRGLLGVSADEALSPTGQQHRRWLVCGIGHHLGLDVHDCADIPQTDYQDAVLEAGMVLTVEPGLYFHAFDELAPPEFRGLGIRSEDDLLVTADGVENLSAALPSDVDELQAWTRRQAGRD